MDGRQQLLKIRGATDPLRRVTAEGQICDPVSPSSISELAGATAWAGWILFFNVQTPCITDAIIGPWENGAL
ncbi:hypothetical protein [Corynebacterium halotolerans]|uniref:Uncharacterized protein n=1 Tax=Corynebacterium halotolerans YIM 70093 = DSM 44683 TaxID=1121362 RepID=M1NNX6_9CORY|nr:hypothetical protein [Corynebacterium halotolerans]AGF71207.1 hypothetical protein A605_00955 [Corynebacterium halotolerans YIM 70093 = DSM 44683]